VRRSSRLAKAAEGASGELGAGVPSGRDLEGDARQLTSRDTEVDSSATPRGPVT
jgi:hypothetical protein